ncbi:hypothetical protein BTVI_19209 [Pitangus sulphuratus]|nr:hypothetical protein BTVI_19209 [Pitangus sulphuratus]
MLLLHRVHRRARVQVVLRVVVVVQVRRREVRKVVVVVVVVTRCCRRRTAIVFTGSVGVLAVWLDAAVSLVFSREQKSRVAMKFREDEIQLIHQSQSGLFDFLAASGEAPGVGAQQEHTGLGHLISKDMARVLESPSFTACHRLCSKSSELDAGMKREYGLNLTL